MQETIIPASSEDKFAEAVKVANELKTKYVLGNHLQTFTNFVLLQVFAFSEIHCASGYQTKIDDDDERFF